MEKIIKKNTNFSIWKIKNPFENKIKSFKSNFTLKDINSIKKEDKINL
ncbi:hypothetical protein [Clostridium sporogenes]|nr:hypothetical protein [Clostridium sporogenes]UAL63914.1 hypothetical protein K8O91_03725 [Clostridium sporogenes]UCA37961.1 hypothetical protein LA363_02895 [Clostridium sporogenes]UJA33062.1 hypothetical protein L0894_04845 [Clostridium sporogenes]